MARAGNKHSSSGNYSPAHPSNANRRKWGRRGPRCPIRSSACQASHVGRARRNANGRGGVKERGGRRAPRGKTTRLGRTCAATVKLSGFYLSEGLPRWSEEGNYFQLIKATYAKTIKVLIGHLFIKTGAVKREEVLHSDGIENESENQLKACRSATLWNELNKT